MLRLHKPRSRAPAYPCRDVFCSSNKKHTLKIDQHETNQTRTQRLWAEIVIQFSWVTRSLSIIHVRRSIIENSTYLRTSMQIIFVLPLRSPCYSVKLYNFSSMFLELNSAFILFNDCYTTYCAEEFNKAYHQRNIGITVNLEGIPPAKPVM